MKTKAIAQQAPSGKTLTLTDEEVDVLMFALARAAATIEINKPLRKQMDNLADRIDHQPKNLES